MRYFLILLLTIPFTQELQVEGNLKVTGSIDAQGNPITNVGNPVQSDDAVNMGFLQTEMTGLAGMKPERIYRSTSANNSQSLTYIVPTNKVWQISISSTYIDVRVNELELPYASMDGGVPHPIWALSNDSVTINNMGEGYFTIFEYSISGSGSDQGLDYIEP
jgi:hypothetical protein